MVPDIQEYASLEDLSTAVGFPAMKLNNLPFGVEEYHLTLFFQYHSQISTFSRYP